MNLIKHSLLALTVFSSFAGADPKIEVGSYQIDPMHSKVGFEVAHLVISSVEGTFKSFSGNIDIASDMAKSKVTAAIDIGSIDTGVAKRDDHLKSADFFAADKFPKMTFQSTAIRGTPEAFQMEGDLTIRGTKKKVTFEGKYLGAATDGFGNRKVAFQAKTKINRKDFGLTWNQVVEVGPVVGDDVTIELKIQGARPLNTKVSAK